MTPRYSLSVQVDSGDPLDVREFSVRERISSLFEIDLVALSPDADLDFDAVVGRRASFRVLGELGAEAPVRLWTGICKHLQQIAVEDTGLTTYELTIVPALWLATQRRNHRMFQQMSELEIARALLEEWGTTPDLRISGRYKKREYRVQYGESDFAFVSRMLEQAGISFFFEQGETETRLVLSDAPEAAAPRPPIPFRDRPTVADREHVTDLRVGQQVRPGRYTLRDHDTRLPPSYPLVATAEAPGAGLEARLERFHYAPGAFLFGTDLGEDTPHADDRGKSRTDENEGRALAQKRLQAKRGSARTCTFATNALDLAPGVVLSVLDHPRADLGAGKRLFVVESALSGTVSREWTHRCEARPADLPFRPPLSTPRPKVSGVESATVVGPPGEEIHTDELGRVRVHFHWDRESAMDHRSSCWIPVSQPWGGSGYGGSNLPRVGQEVLIDFLGGDPDRPVIVGRLYTGLQKTPYKLPDNKTQSGWKSSSSPQTGGYNEIMFEDAAGRELVRMQAERDLHKLVKNDENVTIGNNRTKLVKNDDAFTVGNNRVKVVQNDEDVTIGNNRTKRVQVDDALTVGNDRTKVVQRDERVSIGNNRTKAVENDETVTIGNDHTRTVENDETVTIGNDHTRSVAKNEILSIGQDLLKTVMANAREVTGMSRSVVVGVSQSTQVGMIHSTTVGESFVVRVSPPGEAMSLGSVTRTLLKQNYVEVGTDGGATVTWDDRTVVITSGTGVTVTVSDTTNLDLDPPPPDAKKIVLDTGAGAKIALEGGKITMTAAEGIEIEAKDGDTLIKGSPKVKINPLS
jgi:type VI secretion system secreted protein VgrG